MSIQLEYMRWRCCSCRCCCCCGGNW